MWIQPAAGDAGGSLGAALAYWHHELKMPRLEFKDQMKGSYLGPIFTNEEINQRLTNLGAKFEILEDDALIEKTADDYYQ